MTTHAIETRTLGEEFTAVAFGDEGLEWVPDALETVRAYLERWGAGPVGEPFVREVDGEFEAGFRASTPVGGEGDIEPSDLPSGTAAVVLVATGDGVDERAALDAWIAEQGAAPSGPSWQELLDGDPSGRREIVQPYA